MFLWVERIRDKIRMENGDRDAVVKRNDSGVDESSVNGDGEKLMAQDIFRW